MGKVHNYSLILTGGGSGLRMQSKTPKAFLKLGGHTLLELSLQPFLSFPEITKTVVTVPAGMVEDAKTLFKIYTDENKDLTIVEGGRSRFESVKIAFYHLTEAVPRKHWNESVVIIHDAARPLVSIELIRRVLDAGVRHQAAVPAVDVVDTLIKVSNEETAQYTINRSEIRLVQTPQIFSFSLLKEGYEKYGNDDFTDEGSLVSKIHPVKIIDGEQNNIKITRPQDLEFAKWIRSNEV